VKKAVILIQKKKFVIEYYLIVLKFVIIQMVVHALNTV